MRYRRLNNLLILQPLFWLKLIFAGLFVTGLSGCADQTGINNSGFNPRDTNTPYTTLEADGGLLLMLVPSGLALTNPMVTAWIDAGSEIGVRIRPVTDRQFRMLGRGALKFAGLILPDQLHLVADNELLWSIRSYIQAGGQALLVYDFGTFALNANQKPVYPIPKSRLSDLAGVNYALYNTLREKSSVVGSIAATRSTLRELQVPPGKSSPYLVPKHLADDTTTLTASKAIGDQKLVTPGSVLSLNSAQMTRYAPTNSPAVATDALESYSGYLLGNLIYPSFVTQGTFTGTALAVSPEAGLVAGLNKVGRGQVLFVNLPLTYLKVDRTDGMLMHGFLRYFAHNVLQMAHLSAVPDAVAGLTLNWHLDSFFAQQPTLNLEQLGVFDEGPFSIHMTTGPDAIAPGDGRGWNLNDNPTAQHILQRFVARGHAVGSHGGWNHDYYGINADDTNRGTFLPYLELNADSIARAVSNPLGGYTGLKIPAPGGTPLREYSPPVGNNPLWAMDWLEQQGVVAVYFAGHTGMGPTRQYREGQLRNPGLWVFPVTPFRRYATFEEFQTARTPKQATQDWYRSSVDFAIEHNTTRMIYMHPNGANVWPDVLLDLLSYAKAKGDKQFKWYTMTRLADFMTARLAVTWTEKRDATGRSRFEVVHPSSLDEMVWLLPKTRYADLVASQDGNVTVSDQGAHWAVRAGSARRASFTATILAGRN